MTSRDRSVRLLVTSALFAVLAIGCNGGTPELAKVTGTVRLDGEPLVGAEVAFQPQKRFPPSYGATDNLGRYELAYTKDKPGAAVGTHTVRITTETTSRDESGKEVQIPQRVPKQYNEGSRLIVSVEPGENVLDFDLQSEPQTEEPAAEEAKTQEAETSEGDMEKPGDAEPAGEPATPKGPEAEEPGQEEREAAQP